jgi:hypothetical protein
MDEWRTAANEGDILLILRFNKTPRRLAVPLLRPQTEKPRRTPMPLQDNLCPFKDAQVNFSKPKPVYMCGWKELFHPK